MLGLEVPDKFEPQGELLGRAHWLVVSLDTNIPWPVETQKFTYQDQGFWVLPVTKQSHPAIAMKLGDLDPEDGRRTLLRLLSAISWYHSSGIAVASFSAGGVPRPAGREKTMGFAITGDFNLADLPVPPDDTARLALALMREARALNHEGYAFLSYYRVLEACFPDGRTRWITENVEHARDHRAVEALCTLKATGPGDIGTHLSNSGRHAIAHGNKDPIINPDEPRDTARLRAELPLMRALAEMAVEQQLGVKTTHTEWREHLYELAGFKRYIGEEVVSRVLAGVEPADGDIIDLPTIDVELRRREPYGTFSKLSPVHAQQVDRTLHVVYASADRLVEMSFILDFAEERLRFDWQQGAACADDGSVRAAHNAAEITRFADEYLRNGELRIFDSESRELLSRVDAFIPVNFWGNHEWFTEEIDRWERIAQQRAVEEGERQHGT